MYMYKSYQSIMETRVKLILKVILADIFFRNFEVLPKV